MKKLFSALGLLALFFLIGLSSVHAYAFMNYGHNAFWNETAEQAGLSTQWTTAPTYTTAQFFNGTKSWNVTGTPSINKTITIANFNLTWFVYASTSTPGAGSFAFGVRNTSSYCGSDGQGMHLGYNQGTSAGNWVKCTAGTWSALSTPVAITVGWHAFELRITGTNYVALIDGTQVQTGSDVNIGNFLDAFDTTGKFYLDDAHAWNGTAAGSGPVAPTAPTWVAPTPANNTANATQVTLNASSTSPGVRYYIWFDTNPTPTTLVLNNASTGNWTTNVTSSATYYYIAGVWNSTGNFSTNTTVQQWTYDVVNPTITLNPSNQFNQQNYSKREQYLNKTVFLNISFADNHALYGYNINITRGSTVYYNETNTTLTGTSLVYTKSIDSSTWPVGNYNISIEVDDSHTLRQIRDYLASTDATGFHFTTDEGNDLTIVSLNGSVLASTRRLIDRYTFRFKFDDGLVKARSFLIHSNGNPIDYLPNSNYKAHFVILSADGSNGNWIDFEGVPGVPVVRKINNKNYVVTFLSLDPDVEFQSIGGLNALTANYTFYLGNTTNSTTTAFSQEVSTIFLNVTTDPSISLINATLNYNGTTYTPSVQNSSSLYQFNVTLATPNSSADVNISFNWTVTVVQGDGNTTVFNVSNKQLVRTWTLTTCGTPVFINWTQFDEDTPANLNAGTFQVGFTYWVGNKSNAKTYNATYATASSWSLCFTPVDANFTANVYAQNTVTGGFTHRFYIQNANYSNSTTFYKLYSPLNTSLSAYSDLTITTRQSTDYKYFKNVYAQLQRFYIGTGTWLTVQYDRSGDFGLLFFDVKEQSVDYRLLYYNENNTLLKQTDSLKFVCTSGVCELTQLLDPASSGATTATVTSSMSFNNATGVLSVNWTGSSTISSTVVIKVVKLATATTSICSTSQTGNAGSFTCNATGYTGTLYATVDADGKPNAAQYFDVPRASLGSLISPSFSALITFILMLTIIGFGLFSPMGLVIAVILSLVIVYWVGIFTPITVTFLIISAVIGFVISIKVKQ